MKLITWNVQWCRGVDGRVDPERIVREAKALADFDVICLQEIADNYPAPRLGGNDDTDQFECLAELLPGYESIDGVAVDQPADRGRRRRFGNMVLSRLPVKQVYRHLLPFPCDPGVPGMPRIAVEAVIEGPFGDLRVITTHLEWYSRLQRGAQVEDLRRVYAEGHAHARDGRITKGLEDGPFETFVRPRATVFTGDFNLEYTDALHARMIAPFDDGTPPLHNAWDVLRPGEPYPATFCIYTKMGGPESPELHCDFFFVNDAVVPYLADIRVDQATQASDHQPVILTLR
jgi:endonuclease/exonuclease/phosphatase family metal-dependent hydrolase